jgi:hypothetical protein
MTSGAIAKSRHLQRREGDRWKQQAAAVIEQRQQIAKPQDPSQLLHQRIESLAEKLRS